VSLGLWYENPILLSDKGKVNLYANDNEFDIGRFSIDDLTDL